MSVPRLKTATSLLLLCAVVSGCNGNRAEDLPVITAFHPDGTGGGIDHPEPAGDSNGYVLSYAAGDEVLFSFGLDSDVMTLKEPITLTIVLQKPIRIAVDKAGMLVSIEGGPWQPVLGAFKGAFQSGLSIEQQDRINRGQVTVTANQR